MARKTKSKSAPAASEPTLTLEQLGVRYLEHMEREGKSAGTVFSYGMELKLAQAELGAQTLVADLTAEKIAAFNASPRVTCLKSGKPKAQPSIDKTRRVLRLALAWAAQAGLIALSPVPADKDVVSAAAQEQPAA